MLTQPPFILLCLCIVIQSFTAIIRCVFFPYGACLIQYPACTM